MQALIQTLQAVGKPTEVLECPDGTRVLLLPYGGRVLGLFSPGSNNNFYWTHAALAAAESARAFYASAEWHNSGGDRTWLAPEIDVFFPRFPDRTLYWQPRQLDPGTYRSARTAGSVRLVNRLELELSRTKTRLELEIAKTVAPAPNPLRHERVAAASTIEYAGYTQHTSLELLAESGPPAPVGLWNLVQMPHPGELLVPLYCPMPPRRVFGSIPAEDLILEDRRLRYRMRQAGEHKISLRAVATTGRVGYRFEQAGQVALIVRNYLVDPSGDYVDVLWEDLDDRGYSTQACNVHSQLGSFNELEYHAPAIGGATGRRSVTDVSQVWAFRGPPAAVTEVARWLGLEPETPPRGGISPPDR